MKAVRIALCFILVPLLSALAACSTSKGVRSASTNADATTARSGGYYLNDGPGRLSPAEVAAIPDAVPRAEPVRAANSKPYVVFGRTYTPLSVRAPYRERGVASWYGTRYHGRPTSSGEPYDMYAMTAAHPTLPIPSYVRVTRPDTGRSVIVRVNDRGPFLQNRLIDLSYAAAAKLGFVGAGSAQVEVEAILQFDSPQAVPVRLAQADAPLAPPPPAPAEVAANPEDATPQSVEPDDSPGFWLQLGAFASPDHAQLAVERFRRELAWLGVGFDVQQEDAFYKVQAGPWPQRAQALDAAARVRRATAIQPFATFR